MLFQKTQMSFNEADYVTVHCHEHNDSKRCQNGAQNASTMFLSHHYLAVVGKGLLQARSDKRYSLVKLLCICLCYFFYLTAVNQCLTIIFFKKLCVIGKISIR